MRLVPKLTDPLTQIDKMSLELIPLPNEINTGSEISKSGENRKYDIINDNRPEELIMGRVGLVVDGADIRAAFGTLLRNRLA